MHRICGCIAGKLLLQVWYLMRRENVELLLLCDAVAVYTVIVGLCVHVYVYHIWYTGWSWLVPAYKWQIVPKMGVVNGDPFLILLAPFISQEWLKV